MRLRVRADRGILETRPPGAVLEISFEEGRPMRLYSALVLCLSFAMLVIVPAASASGPYWP